MSTATTNIAITIQTGTEGKGNRLTVLNANWQLVDDLMDGDVTPKTLGTASAGTNTLEASRADHVHALTYGDDADFMFGDGLDAALRWSLADASNHTLVLGLGDSNQAIHITDKGARATDWAIAATTHPTLFLHSNTTPITDYLKIGAHDGSVAYIDVVGGTTLRLAIAGTNEIDLTSTAFSPATSDGNALGTTSLMWGDLFLASGSVANWNNGDVTLTHAAGKLTWGGDGSVELDFNNHEMTNVDINGGAVDGTTIGAAAASSALFTTVGATGLITATGGQIAFPSSQAASSGANTLDDYEEGSWAPTGNNVTYTGTDGSYVKIGQLVVASFTFTMPTTSDTNTAQITNLPFTAMSDSDHFQGGHLTSTNYTTPLTLLIDQGTDNMAFYTYGASAQNNATLSTKQFRGVVTYRASA